MVKFFWGDDINLEKPGNKKDWNFELGVLVRNPNFFLNSRSESENFSEFRVQNPPFFTKIAIFLEIERKDVFLS